MKRIISLFSLLLVISMILGSFVACGNGNTSDTETASESTEKKTEEKTMEDTFETDSEKTTEDETEIAVKLEGEHAEIIELNNSLANGVQAYFTDKTRTHYNIQNTEMTMSYSRSSDNDQYVAYIKNTQGHSYIENTIVERY